MQFNVMPNDEDNHPHFKTYLESFQPHRLAELLNQQLLQLSPHLLLLNKT